MKTRTKVILVLSILFVILITYFTTGFTRDGLKGFGYMSLLTAASYDCTIFAQTLLDSGIPASPAKGMGEWSYQAEISDTPLHYAAQNGNYALAKALIDHGAYIDWCCCSCVTPLHKAIIAKQKDIVVLLLESGANAGKNYDLTYTSIELAEKKSTAEIVQILRQHMRNIAK